MKLHQQRERLIDGILGASTDLKYLRSSILRKMAAPYGDGSRSNMVNAETDVLPRLADIIETLAATLEAVSRAEDGKPLKIDLASSQWIDGGDALASGGRMGG
jgi:hypothetical protein